MNWSPLQFKPIYKERPWGGRALDGWGGRKLPPRKTIGESWEMVDREEDQSVVSNGSLAGKTIRWLIENHPEELLGRRFKSLKRFPLLVKLLDCKKRLSLQVHPPAKVSSELGGEPKTESWFVLKAKPDAKLMVGLKQGVTRDQFEAALKTGKLKPLVHEFHVRPGDYIFIPSGRIHAIGGGLLILEIQQNSDTTYRVFDWGRKGLDGKHRQLHIAESMMSIDFNDFEPGCSYWDQATGTLVRCPEFEVSLHTPLSLEKINLESFKLIYVLEGEGQIAGQPMLPHSLWFLPAALQSAKVAGDGSFRFFVVDMP